MADNARTTPDFAALSLALEARPLQLEGGNVIIKLGDGPHDTLIVHSDVLAAASEHFAARLKSTHWEATRVVRDPKTGEGLKVFEYHLVQIEDTYCLTDEEAAAKAVSPAEGPEDDGNEWGVHANLPRYVSFHESSLVDGYRCSGDYPYLENADVRAQSVYEHGILFSMLYYNALELDLGNPKEALATLTNLTALCEYYLLLSSLANQLSTAFTSVPGFWKAVALNPETYLALGVKLHSHDIFADALRHIASRSTVSVQYGPPLFNSDPISPEIAATGQRKADQLRKQAEGLTRQLRSIGLSTYQAHPKAKTKRARGPVVRTTWLAAGTAKKDLEKKCRWIAASIYREKLDQLIYGDPHWSHVQYIHNGRNSGAGDVDAGSLFIAAKALLAAHRDPDKLNLFGHQAANKFAAIFGLQAQRTGRVNPAARIAAHLRGLVRAAVHAVQYWLPLPGEEANEYAQGKAARDGEAAVGFTAINVYWDDFPWQVGGDGQKVEMGEGWDNFRPDREVVAAGEDWLKVVGL